MPTARELLEQADALMRRNRERVEAERVAREQADFVEVEVEIEAEPVSADDGRLRNMHGEAVRDEEIPELTDVVADEAAPVIDLRPAVSELEDVPELTDAVEEIEAPSILELPADEGEPSQWLEIDRGEVSVTGPAPDSVVALVDVMSRPGASDEAPFSEPAAAQDVAPVVAPGPGSAAALTAAYMAGALTGGKAGHEAEDALGGGTVNAAGEIVAETGTADANVAEFDAAAETVADALPDVMVDRAAELGGEVPPAPAELAAPVPTSTEEVERAAAGFAAADEPAAPLYLVETLEGPIPPAISEVVVPTLATEPGPAIASLGDAIAAAPDALHWDVLAEEIRMQVLQRNDIFTDTGLQEQLAARLQPIVDRASADLVATINREVGRLLRTYVAEAIEREIEKWRQEGG